MYCFAKRYCKNTVPYCTLRSVQYASNQMLYCILHCPCTVFLGYMIDFLRRSMKCVHVIFFNGVSHRILINVSELFGCWFRFYCNNCYTVVLGHVLWKDTVVLRRYCTVRIGRGCFGSTEMVLLLCEVESRALRVCKVSSRWPMGRYLADHTFGSFCCILNQYCITKISSSFLLYLVI